MNEDSLKEEIIRKAQEGSRPYASALYNSTKILTWYDVKQAILAGKSDQEIIDNAPILFEIVNYLPKVRLEIETEQLIAETKLGKVLYE